MLPKEPQVSACAIAGAPLAGLRQDSRQQPQGALVPRHSCRGTGASRFWERMTPPLEWGTHSKERFIHSWEPMAQSKERMIYSLEWMAHSKERMTR